jgi:hypothetical protein
MDSKTKIRIALASVSVLFLILIGYLMVVDYVWTVEALIIGSFAFFGTFTISDNTALFVTMLIFGIFVLPFIFYESGFLDDSTDEQPDNFGETGQSIMEAEEQVDRLIGFLKSRFGSINKVRNYSLFIGITSTIIGCGLSTLPSFFLTDSELIWIHKTEEWFVREYYGFIRGHLLLIGILLLLIGLILIIRHIRRNPHSTGNKNFKPISIQTGPRVR